MNIIKGSEKNRSPENGFDESNPYIICLDRKAVFWLESALLRET